MSGYSRGNPAMGDIVRSVLVLGGIVLALWLFGRLFTVTPDEPTASVDWQTAASGVEPRAGYAPLVPPSLPEGWRATTAKLTGTQWQLGVVTDDGGYIGLTQASVEPETLLRDRAPGSKAAGEVELGGRTWQERTGPEEDTTFVTTVGEQAVVVRGSADRDVLEDYVASLVPFSD